MSAKKKRPLPPLIGTAPQLLRTPSDRSQRSERAMLVLAVGLLFIFRLWYASFRELTPDEAFYWFLSRHLAAGYLDHPPMVAYLIRLSTLIGSSTELGVRFLTIVMAFASIGLLMRLGQLIFGQQQTADGKTDRRPYLWLGMLWFVNPLFNALATLSTPDTPTIFFSLCALVCAVTIAKKVESKESDGGGTLIWWLLFGCFCGVAMLTKYTAILVPGSVALALLFSRAGRRQLLRPGIYLAAIVALLIFSPVIYWNSTHQWVSFRYQLHHGLATHDSISPPAGPKGGQVRSLVEFIAGQFMIWTPVMMVLALVVLVQYWRRFVGGREKRLGLSRSVLLWAATVPLVFFAFAATRAKGEGNWPAFAYFPLSLLLVDWVSRKWDGGRVFWLKIGCGLAFLLTAVLHMPELPFTMHLLGPHSPVAAWREIQMPKKLAQLYGWRAFGRELSAKAHGAMVVTTTHQDAAEAAFYMVGQPETWCLSVGDEARPTSFKYLDNKPDLANAWSLLLVNFGADKAAVEQELHMHEWSPLYGWTQFIFGHARERDMVLVGRFEPIPEGEMPTTATLPATTQSTTQP